MNIYKAESILKLAYGALETLGYMAQQQGEQHKTNPCVIHFKRVLVKSIII